MSERNEKLAKNTVLFAIGNLGSKLLQIILVPFYTRVMTSAEFGTADVLQAVVSLLLPIGSLTIYEAVFRYAMEKEYNKNAVFTVGVFISAIGTLIVCGIGLFVSALIDPLYVWLVIGNAVAGFLRSLLSQYTRSVEKTALFTLDNVMLTVYVLVFNITFIVAFDMGVVGYMLGYTLANVLSCAFLYVALGSARRLDVRAVNGGLVREMLWFSIPLIPNAVCWWISSFIDRIVITTVVGEAANGIYAAAHKIPSLLTVVVTIFFQAWQISANQEFRSKDIHSFYSDINGHIIATVTAISSVLILLCRPITQVFLGEEYQDAWRVMPLLLLAMTFFSFAQFLGSIYSANKKTTMAFVTNLIGVVVCLLLNLFLVVYCKVGILGSAIATSVSYFVLWITRVFSTRKIIRLNQRIGKVIPAIVLLSSQAILVTANWNASLTYGISAVITIILLAIFMENYRVLVRFSLRFVGRILGRKV